MPSGDETAREKFVEIAEAYEVLSSSTTRKIYDQFGHEGVEQHRQGGAAGRQQANDPFDLFSRFFGGGGHFGNTPGQRRGPDMELRLLVPLRDLYLGQDEKLRVGKQQICEACEGSGSADGHVHTCDRCGGRGVVVQKHQLAPGMFQQIQMMCDKCGGKGNTIKKPCPVCHGKRVLQKEVEMTVTVEPGMDQGTRIVFENEADESPDWVAGDLVFIVEEEAPPQLSTSDDADRTDGAFFRRRGKDLFWKEALSLREAWMGDWTRNLTHLDGHLVQLGRKRGQVVQPLTVERIAGEGMPIYDEGHMYEQNEREENSDHGSLYVEYMVILPDEMESTMEDEFYSLWEKWRAKVGVNLDEQNGRKVVPREVKDEL